MQYRRLGRTGFDVSEVGLGTEYLIDKPRSVVAPIIDAAIAAGVNYFDLFFAQPAFRDTMGELFFGRRDQLHLTAHLGASHDSGQYEAIRDPVRSRELIDDYLQRYGTDYVDVLFLHNCDSVDDYEEVMRPGGLKDVALELRDRGVARAIGFSGHTVETALRAIRTGIVDVLMFPISVAGNLVAGKAELLAECARRDVGVVAMKVFGGGKLLTNWDEAQFNMWQLGGTDATIAGPQAFTPVRGLHYALSQPAVATVVPGCGSLAELEADVAYVASCAEERDFSATLESTRQFTNACVYCNHCLPCPAGIDIGHTIRLLETVVGDSSVGAARPESVPKEIAVAYSAMETTADECVECGDCEERCPFGVSVIERMRETVAVFGTESTGS